MSTSEVDHQWRQALDGLTSWHTRQDRRAAESALAFIEVELRLRIPAAVRRRWPAEQVDDALQGFLLRLLCKPLPDEMNHPSAYLTTMFRNRCIDLERGRKREPIETWDERSPIEQSLADPESRQELERVAGALDQLSMEDRVAIKMTDAPEILTWEELTWLGGRASLSAIEVRDRVLACHSVYELTLLFDPGELPTDGKVRRDRMERFRKRRERARQRLHASLGGPS